MEQAQRRVSKTLRLFSVMLGGSLVVIAGILGHWATDRSLPIEVVSAKVSSTNVRPGAELVWEIKFIQHKRCNIHSDRVLFDSENAVHPLPAIDYINGIGELDVEQDMTLKIPVPPDMPFGTTRFEGTTVYKCNPLHHIWPLYSPYNPVFFEVVPL